MTPLPYRGLQIHVTSFEEPHGIWWPNATIEDPSTGETAPVSLPSFARSQEEAALQALREARMRIRANTWHN